MLIRGRSCIAAITACFILLLFAAESYPSYNSEAGRKYAVAQERLTDLKKSSKKKKYRSYWMDCIRTFEAVEKKYPKSPNAADACFDRAGLYLELFQYNKLSKDMDDSLLAYGKCQTAYPKHGRAPEALFHVFEITLDLKKDRTAALKAYNRLAAAYPDNNLTSKARTRINPPSRKKKPEQEIRKTPVPVITAPGKTKKAILVKSIRHWSGGAHTRIVIDVNKPVKFQAEEMSNPSRLVFTLQNARLDDSVDKEPHLVKDGILKQVSAIQYAPDTVRVVLDLANFKSYKTFPLRGPDRLVIDVNGEGGAQQKAMAASSEPGMQSDAVNTGETASDHKEKPDSAANDKSQQEPNIVAKAEPPAASLIPKVPEVKNNDGDKTSLSRQLGLKIKTIAIDAGHGGHDPGAIGKSGLQEKSITLDVAKRLAILVKERLGCDVVMTRDKDVFIPLEERPFIAKSKGADLFVSIHVNANRKRKARGIETYIQSFRASDREAMATAARENAMSTKKLSELKSELDRIFADLTRDDKLEESLQLAHAVQGSLIDAMKPVQGHVVNLGVKRAFFYVLINTEMPSILAEVGFISNPDEEKMLKKDSYKQSVAEALFQGVKKYVEARSPQMLGI